MELPLAETSFTCDICQIRADLTDRKIVRRMERVRIPRGGHPVLFDNSASGGRKIHMTSAHHIYYFSTFHHCKHCYDERISHEKLDDRSYQRVLITIVSLCVVITAITFLPGFSNTLKRMVTGHTEEYWEYSTHPINIPSTPYKDPFPGVPADKRN